MDFINGIIRFSLRHRFIVIVGALLLVAAGIYSARKMDIDVFPDLTAPTVVVMTDANGMAAEEVERLITFPIETAVNGSTNVRRVRSASLQGVSFVWAEFDWGTDIYRARQTVSEKMVAISSSLPEGVTPELSPQSSIMGEIMTIGLQADSTSMMDLRTLADWVVKPAILATGGVAQVTNIGGELRQYQIIPKPQQMALYGVSYEDLEAVGRSFSSNSVGSVIREYGNEYVVRGIARANNLDELGKSLVKMSGNRPVMLSEVADVRIGHALRMGNATYNAAPAVLLAVSKQPDVNTIDVTAAIERNLEEIAKSLPADVKMDTHIFRQADFINSAVDNVAESLIEGALFAVIIIFLFLASWRTTIISVIAIPLSLLGTCAVLYLLGMDINTMTLGGMCLAIGSLVDDAIIDVENVYKRLRQNFAKPRELRESAITVVFNASAEIRASILNATLIIIVAFMPLFFLSGMEGRMLKPLGTAYIISLFMSLLVAMTVTPLLCRDMLSPEKYLSRNREPGKIERWLTANYRRALEGAMRRGRLIFWLTAGAFAVTVVIFLNMGQAFLPDFNEGSAVVSAVARPGVSLDVNNELGYMIERELLDIPGVTSTARRTGRGELDEHSQTTNGAEIEVQFDLNGRTRQELFDEMRHRLANIPGVVTTIGQPLGHRIDHILSGTQANIAIKIFGTELGSLYMLGNKVKSAIAEVPGVVDLSVEQQIETPQLQVRANRDALARYGITIDEFNRFITMAFSGEKIADMYEGQRKFDVVMRLDSDYSGSIDELKDALIDTGDGGKVALSQVADIVSAGGPSSISRENVQRKLVVSANVSGRDVGSAVNDIREIIDREITLPEGYRIEYGGQFESAQSATRTLLLASLTALLLIYLLLYGEFSSFSLSALVLLNLPFALIGGVVAVALTSGVISIPSIIGFITLFGVATRNGILLISRYRHLRQSGEALSSTIINGSADRLNPILMTALSTGLALIPLIFNGDKSGNEIQSPMAIVVLGGLFTSTLLNVFVMPIIYRWYEERKNNNTNK